MGRDSHPATRQRLKLERKQGNRTPGRRFLIVCEGSKTEIQYLEEIRIALRLSSAHLHVTHEGVTEPRQIVEAAWKAFHDGKMGFRKKAADVVVAVFDRDEHRTYSEALELAREYDRRGQKNDEKLPVRFLAVPSNSCFEFWLLLHWKDVQAPVHRHDAFKQVRQYLSDYEKGSQGVFANTFNRMPEAMRRACRLEQRFNALDGPYTSMHSLLQVLLDPEVKLPDPGQILQGNQERIPHLDERMAEMAKILGSSKGWHGN